MAIIYENDYYAYYAVNLRNITHLLVNKKTGRRWLVHANGTRYPVGGDGLFVLFSLV